MVANRRSFLDGPARSELRAAPRGALESAGQLPHAVSVRRLGDCAPESLRLHRRMALRARRSARRYGADSDGLHPAPPSGRMRRAFSGRPSRGRAPRYLSSRTGRHTGNARPMPAHRCKSQGRKPAGDSRPVGALPGRRGPGAGVVSGHRSQRGPAGADIGVRGMVLGIMIPSTLAAEVTDALEDFLATGFGSCCASASPPRCRVKLSASATRRV